jgi:hypothetical protein
MKGLALDPSPVLESGAFSADLPVNTKKRKRNELSDSIVSD